MSVRHRSVQPCSQWFTATWEHGHLGYGAGGHRVRQSDRLVLWRACRAWSFTRRDARWPHRQDARATFYSFSTDTSVALIIAKTVSPSLRFIRCTEPVVIIDVTLPAAVRMTTSDTTLSETIFSIVPAKRFRMLVLISKRYCHVERSETSR